MKICNNLQASSSPWLHLWKSALRKLQFLVCIFHNLHYQSPALYVIPKSNSTFRLSSNGIPSLKLPHFHYCFQICGRIIQHRISRFFCLVCNHAEIRTDSHFNCVCRAGIPVTMQGFNTESSSWGGVLDAFCPLIRLPFEREYEFYLAARYHHWYHHHHHHHRNHHRNHHHHHVVAVTAINHRNVEFLLA